MQDFKIFSLHRNPSSVRQPVVQIIHIAHTIFMMQSDLPKQKNVTVKLHHVHLAFTQLFYVLYRIMTPIEIFLHCRNRAPFPYRFGKQMQNAKIRKHKQNRPYRNIQSHDKSFKRAFIAVSVTENKALKSCTLTIFSFPIR